MNDEDEYDSSRANDAHYVARMFEEMRDILRTVNEGVTAIRQTVNNQPTRDEFNDLSQRVDTIGASITDLSRDLKKHKSLPANAAHGR